MGIISWAFQCIPGISIVGLLILVNLALNDIHSWVWIAWFSSHEHGHGRDTLGSPDQQHHVRHSDNLAIGQMIYVIYTIFVHLMALGFPLRLLWALWHLTGSVKRASLSPIDTSSTWSCDDGQHASNESQGMAIHAILLPNYKEDIDTLRETLDVLASHAQARTSYDVSPIFDVSCANMLLLL